MLQEDKFHQNISWHSNCFYLLFIKILFSMYSSKFETFSSLVFPYNIFRKNTAIAKFSRRNANCIVLELIIGIPLLQRFDVQVQELPTQTSAKPDPHALVVFSVSSVLTQAFSRTPVHSCGK